MALTDLFIRKVKYAGSVSGEKYSDGRGLYLLVKKANKYWRLNYRYAGVQKMLPLGIYPEVSLFVRPGELRAAEWCEIDLDAGEWRIPAAKMKMKAEHMVPLATQVV
jgi:integrase